MHSLLLLNVYFNCDIWSKRNTKMWRNRIPWYAINARARKQYGNRVKWPFVKLLRWITIHKRNEAESNCTVISLHRVNGTVYREMIGNMRFYTMQKDFVFHWNECATKVSTESMYAQGSQIDGDNGKASCTVLCLQFSEIWSTSSQTVTMALFILSRIYLLLSQLHSPLKLVDKKIPNC